MKNEKVNSSADSVQVTAPLDITDCILPEDKFKVDGIKYVKGSVLGGTKQNVSHS